jgi:hypothetical protein
MKRRPFLERFASRKQQMPRVAVGFAWYANEHTWAEMKAFAEDPERYENSYAEWVAMVSKTMANFDKSGLQLVKVPMEPEGFRQWLLANGGKNDASARAAYASEKVREYHQA